MEYGGYLPLELNIKKEYFSTNDRYSVVALNSGRTAIWYALKQMNISKVVLPWFYCPTVIEMLKEEYELTFYHLDKNFNPILYKNMDSNETAIILVNYYGVLEETVKAHALKFTNVVVDYAHSFFSNPILRDNVYNVYSCRKFFGVADGAYLISTKINKEINLEEEKSFDRCIHLLKSIEMDTNAAYNLSLENERYVGNTRKYMSKLTKRILSSIDYDNVRKRRIANFNTLNSLLLPYQKIKGLADNVPAYCYPLYLSKDIRSDLIEKKVWIPTLWKELIDQKWKDKNEYYFSKNIVCLPIDQRYIEKDMIKLSKIVVDCIESKTY